MDQERLVHVLDRVGLLADADRQGREAHRSTAELLAQRGEQRTVELVESEVVDAEYGQPVTRDVGRDAPVGTHLGEVAHAPQQPVGNARRTARAAGDLPGTVLIDLDVDDAGRSSHDLLQLVVVVIVEPGDEPEPVAKWPGDHARAGGGADQGERRHRQPDARCRRPLAHHDVELEVLHRRVQDLLHRSRQAVDLVDEEDITLFELGEDGCQIAGALECRARCDVEVDPHLGGDDAGQRGLAEPWRPGEEEVIDRLPAAASRLEHDREVLLELALADELGQGARSQSGLDHLLDVGGDARLEELIPHGALRAT